LEARFLLLESLKIDIIDIELDLSIYQLKITFSKGVLLYIRYNEFGEYAYQIILSPRKFDYVRYDNFDDRWPIKTRPHHFHQKNNKPVIESPMNGNPAHDMPILIKFIKEQII